MVNFLPPRVKKCLNNVMSNISLTRKKDCNLNAGWRGQKLFVKVLYFIWVKVKRAKLCHFQVFLPQMRCWLTIFEVNPPPLNTAIVRWKKINLFTPYTLHTANPNGQVRSRMLCFKEDNATNLTEFKVGSVVCYA